MKEDTVYYSIVDKGDLIGDNETTKAFYLLEHMLNKFNISIVDIVKNEYGKPYFTNNIYFNYSHSKNYIACAISLSEVGIDIEEDRPISDEIATRYLDGNKDLQVWVQKEAYSKLKGLGFAIDFSTINLSNITNKNMLIKNDKYICSIYSDKDNIIFKEMEFNYE